jgi:small subunit ribosomal protein S14
MGGGGIGGLGAAKPEGAEGFGGTTGPALTGLGTAATAGFGTGAGTTTDGLGGMGADAAAGGGGIPGTEGAGGRPGLGGAGMVGGAPTMVGRGLGGRLIMAASRGLAAPGLPSRRGGRTMRTVSFLGSFMAGFSNCGLVGMELRFPTGRQELTGARGVSNISRSQRKICPRGELLLACGVWAGDSKRLFFKFMAKTAWKEREKRKRKVVDKYAELRAELKKKGDYLALAQLPRNASPVRLSNRCRVSGRKRAFLREFQMSRLTFRELACAGLIPGVTKASW